MSSSTTRTYLKDPPEAALRHRDGEDGARHERHLSRSDDLVVDDLVGVGVLVLGLEAAVVVGRERGKQRRRRREHAGGERGQEGQGGAGTAAQ